MYPCAPLIRVLHVFARSAQHSAASTDIALDLQLDTRAGNAFHGTDNNFMLFADGSSVADPLPFEQACCCSHLNSIHLADQGPAIWFRPHPNIPPTWRH